VTKDGAGNVRARAPLALACSLLLAACQAVPPTSPPSQSAAPPTPPDASATAGVEPPALAEALRDAIDVDDILTDLDRLQQIATDHDGNRAAGTSGHEASVAFVAGELRAAGYQVELQPVDLPVFVQLAPSTLTIDAAGAPTLEDLRDFKAMTYSATGDVTATVFALGFDPNAKPGDRGGLGCDPAAWASVPRGAIVLLQPGPCTRHDAIVNAQAAGAAAVVTSYADWPRDHVLRPTLIEPGDIHIPAFGATHAVGLALADAAGKGAAVHVTTRTLAEHRSSSNLIAETPGGDPSDVLMLGGHLDSVLDGPGINDDGSGTMAVLEIARELAALTSATPASEPRWKVRVAFWTGEELGIFGSAAYARNIGNQRDGPVRAYLNFDMLGSPNGVRTVYDGAVTSRPAESAAITKLFTTALDAATLPWELESVGAVSDHFPLEQAGIPVGGLFSGANELKSADQATEFGGTAGLAMDACYHLACDTKEDLDPVLLDQLARAAAWVTGALASGEVTLAPS
jgi:Zn-dependent M28 family amino/carboxypeptidase